MTIFAKRDEIIRSIAAAFTAFQMMYVELYGFSGRFMRSTALAGISITMEYILTNVIFVVHFTELIIFADWQRFTSFHCFQTLKIEFCRLNTNFRKR